MYACMRHRLLMNGPGLSGILVVLHACIDIKGTILDKFHYLLFYLAPAMNPRYMCMVDPDLQAVSANVRVGEAVETVGQAGRPKTITGFQVGVCAPPLQFLPTLPFDFLSCMLSPVPYVMSCITLP